MSEWKRPATFEEPDPPAAPHECPACRSTDVTTASKVTSESYWRCMGCGEVWNVARRAPTRGGMYRR